MERHKDTFTEDFAKNKAMLDKFVNVNCRKLKNIIAGYLTKLVKLEKSEK